MDICARPTARNAPGTSSRKRRTLKIPIRTPSIEQRAENSDGSGQRPEIPTTHQLREQLLSNSALGLRTTY